MHHVGMIRVYRLNIRDVLRVNKCDGVPQMYLYIGLSATSLGVFTV